MIKIEDLHKSFGQNEVLKGISTEVKEKEVIAIIGPSGSGKSTFLRCLNLLETPTSGKVTIAGDVLTDKGTNIMKIREEVGMVFQHFHLFPHKTVLENLTYAPINVKGMDKATAINKAEELLKKVGLFEKRQEYPNRLSGDKSSVLPLREHLPWTLKLYYLMSLHRHLTLKWLKRY